MKKITLSLIIFALFAFLSLNLCLASGTSKCEYIDVAFTIDRNFYVYTLNVIESILKHNDSNSRYRFHIVENNLTPLNKFLMKTYAKYRKVDLVFYSVSTEGFNKLFVLKRLTPISMSRISLSSILPNCICYVIR